jgi:DNA-binding MarR family transcriptional regulator
MTADTTREAIIDEIVATLPRRSALLVRLVHRHAASPIPRGMSTMLTALDGHPQRITELADREGLAQPTVTRMIVRLETLGLVTRERDRDDGRVVVVAITDKGHDELHKLRARFAEVLRESLEALPAEQLDDLHRGSAALQGLVDELRDPGMPTA